MPDLTISDLKRALVEVKRICQDQFCSKHCPFVVDGACPLVSLCPGGWECPNDWEEDAHAQTD